MRIMIVDGQGGGLGRNLVEQLKMEKISGLQIIATATNSTATAAMLKAGADAGATGENAIIYNSTRTDIIAGPMGILLANSMLGEITPAIAAAISASEAEKVLVPVTRCHTHVAGVEEKTMAAYLTDAVELIRRLALEADEQH